MKTKDAAENSHDYGDPKRGFNYIVGGVKGPEDTFTVQYVYHYKFVFYFFNPLGRIFRGCLVFSHCSRNVAVQPAD